VDVVVDVDLYLDVYVVLVLDADVVAVVCLDVHARDKPRRVTSVDVQAHDSVSDYV